MVREIFGNELPPTEVSKDSDIFHNQLTNEDYVFDNGKWNLLPQQPEPESPTIPEPSVEDAGKVIAVNDLGEYELVNPPEPSSGVEEKQINFYDYEGTRLYAYTAQEWANITELPANPDRTSDGLIAQGWNWTKAEIDEQLAETPYAKVSIGQMYGAPNDASFIKGVLTDKTKDLRLNLVIKGTVSVDWGDGSEHTEMTGVSLSSTVRAEHNYSSAGEFCITITPSADTSLLFTTYVLSVAGNTNDYLIHKDCIREVHLGSNFDMTSHSNSTRSSIFKSCYSLEKISMANPVSENSIIGSQFLQCANSVKCFVVPRNVVTIMSTSFSNCEALERVIFHRRISSFGSGVLSGGIDTCTQLKEFYIPPLLTSLTFNFGPSPHIKEVTIPANITTFESNTRCAITELHMKPLSPPSTFPIYSQNVSSLLTIYVPAESLSEYQAATNWSKYASKMVGE